MCVFSLIKNVKQVQIVLVASLLLVLQVLCQDACERLTVDILGSSDMLSQGHIISEILTPGGEVSTFTSVRILNMTIVCEAQHEMQNRYRYTSVVISFNCFSTDARVPECANSSVVHTEQFDFGCNRATWTTNILTVSTEARTTNPIATLSTELDTGCILCVNPNHPILPIEEQSFSNITHCAGMLVETSHLNKTMHNYYTLISFQGALTVRLVSRDAISIADSVRCAATTLTKENVWNTVQISLFQMQVMSVVSITILCIALS